METQKPEKIRYHGATVMEASCSGFPAIMDVHLIMAKLNKFKKIN